jgi:tetratricopeptide (TPR) repeat protein
MDMVERFAPELWLSVTGNVVVTGLLVSAIAMSLLATIVCFVVTFRSHGVPGAVGRTAVFALLDALLIGIVAVGLGTSVTRLPISLPGKDTVWLFLPALAIYYVLAVAAHVLLSLGGCIVLAYVWAVRQLHLQIEGGSPDETGRVGSLRARLAGLIAWLRSRLAPGPVGLATLAGILIVSSWETSGWPIYVIVGVEALILLGIVYTIRSILITVVQRVFWGVNFDTTISKRRLEFVAIVISYLILCLGSFAIIFFHHIDVYLLNFIGMYVGLTALDDVAAYLGVIRLPLQSSPRELSPNRWYFTCPLVLLIMSLGATGAFNAILINSALDSRVWLEAGGAAFAFMLFTPLTDSARYSAGVRDLHETNVAPAVTRSADSADQAHRGTEDQVIEVFDRILESPILDSSESSRAMMSLRAVTGTPLTERLRFPCHAFFLATGLLYHVFMSNQTITNLLVSGFVPVVFVVTAAVTGVVPLLNNPRLEPVREVFIFLVFVISAIAGISVLFTTALTSTQLKSLLQAHDVGQTISGQSFSAILYNVALQSLVLLTVAQLAYLFRLINTVIAVEQEQKSASDLAELGTAFEEAGDYLKAGKLYKRAYKADPASFNTWWGFGRLLNNRATYQQALSAYERALSLAPDDEYCAIVWRDMADTYRQQGQYQKALEACEEAWKLQPSWAWLVVWLPITQGQVYSAMGNFEEAEYYYRSADWNWNLYYSKEDSDWEQIHTSLIELYRVTGHYDAAILECLNTQKRRPDSPWPLNSLGWVYISQEKYDTALETFQRGLKKRVSDRDKSSFNNAIGEVYFRQGLLPQAFTYYSLAVEQNRYDVTSFNQVALVYRRQGEFQDALAVYRHIVNKFSDDQWARIGLIACLRKLENTTEQQQAITEARRLIRSEDEYMKACLESVCGNNDQAFDLLRVAMEKKQRQPVEVRIDEDLSFIRNDPRFEQILGEYSTQEGVANT